MNNTKPAVASSTITRDLRELDIHTDNIYESIVIMSKRANQISNNVKEELHQKLSEFASSNDNLLKTVNKLKYQNTTNVCQKHRW
jgi:hypothetical protein